MSKIWVIPRKDLVQAVAVNSNELSVDVVLTEIFPWGKQIPQNARLTVGRMTPKELWRLYTLFRSENADRAAIKLALIFNDNDEKDWRRPEELLKTFEREREQARTEIQRALEATKLWAMGILEFPHSLAA